MRKLLAASEPIQLRLDQPLPLLRGILPPRPPLNEGGGYLDGDVAEDIAKNDCQQGAFKHKTHSFSPKSKEVKA